MKIRQPINTEQQNPETARVRLENLTLEQADNTIEQVGQGNEIYNINQPVQQEERFEENETFVVENKEAIEEIKVEILEEFFKTQNIDIEEREPLLKLEKNKKNKINIRIDNIALTQIITDIKPNDITKLNELTYSTTKAILERCGMKKKNRNRTSHKQPAWKRKIQEKTEAFKGELSILEDLSKGINVKTRKGRKVKIKYKLQNENDIKIAKERIKQKAQVKVPRIRRFEKRT